MPTDWRDEPKWSVTRNEQIVQPMNETSAGQASSPEEQEEEQVSIPPKTPSRAQERPKVGQETLTRLEQLRNVLLMGKKQFCNGRQFG